MPLVQQSPSGEEIMLSMFSIVPVVASSCLMPLVQQSPGGEEIMMFVVKIRFGQGVSVEVE